MIEITDNFERYSLNFYGHIKNLDNLKFGKYSFVMYATLRTGCVMPRVTISLQEGAAAFIVNLKVSFMPKTYLTTSFHA